ncbi:MAG: DMT family transporter [Elusimicrobia bacterium]|nr:DMT family transporter [Elusimicrobiota bacterium]
MPPFAALVGCWLLNAFWPIIGQSGLSRYSTTLFFHAGLLLGLLAALPWLLRDGRWRRVLTASVGLPLLAMAALSCSASLIYLEALRYTTPANAAVMAQVEVLYSAGLSAWLLREAIGPAQIAASLLVVSGTGLILAHDLGGQGWKGDLMILCTPWMYQVSHVIAKRLPKGLDAVLVSGSRNFFGLLLLAPLSAWAVRHGGRWSWSADSLAVLAAQGLLMNALALLLWYAAILRMDLAKATAFLLSYPALTMLFSWALGRESIHPVQVAGLVVTLAGAYWLSRMSMSAQAGGGPKSHPLLGPDAQAPAQPA